MIAAAIIIAILILIGLIPLGVAVSFTEGGLGVSVIVSVHKLRVFPPDKPREKKPKEPKEKKPRKKSGFISDNLPELLKLILNTLAGFRHRLRFDKLMLHYIAAGADPYEGVMSYNRVNAFVNGFAPTFERAFRVNSRDIYIGLDYEREKALFETSFELTIRVFRVFSLVIVAGWAILKIWIAHKIRTTKERKSSDGQQVKRSNAVNNEQH